MKFSISQKEFNNALSTVMKGVSTRSTLPILSGIFMEARGEGLILQTTDLELSIQITVNALVEEEGKTVLPGKLVTEIVKSLPDAAVHFEKNEESATISCDAASFSLKTLDPQDFPGFPHVEAQQKIELPFDQVANMIKRVAKVVSKDESRAILTGVLMTLEGENLKLVATDSYRLAIAQASVPNALAGDFDAVIAGSFLQDIASLPKSDETLSIALSENQIVISYGETIFINRRIEGNFPNYNQLLPDSYLTRAKMDTAQLASAVKRVSLLNNTASPVKFDIDQASQTVLIASIAQDVGSAQETLGCEAEGEDSEIAFNHSYLIDGLSVISTDEVYLEMQTSMKPGIFRAIGEDDFLYLVMPVRLS